MKIGYVVKKYPRLSETFILNEILGLEAAGVDVSVFSLNLPDEGRFHPQLARQQGEVHYLPAFGSRPALEAFQSLRDLGVDSRGLTDTLGFVDLLPDNKRASLLIQALHLARQARDAGISHLHAHFMTGAAHCCQIAHVVSGLPFSVTAHAKDVYRNTVDRKLFVEIANTASAVVTVCEANRRFIEDELLAESSSAARIVRIYNGIPLDDFTVDPQPRDPQLILGVGRLVEKKGFGVLLQACAVLRDRGFEFRCVIAGEGDERGELERSIARLGLQGRVSLVGATTRDQVAAWMARARVLAAPCVTASDGNQDALPTVLLEALAAGLPVVSTTLGGIPEIVDDGIEGMLVEPGAVAELADALQVVVTEDQRWRAMSAAARRKVASRFDARSTLPELIALFADSTFRSQAKQVVA